MLAYNIYLFFVAFKFIAQFLVKTEVKKKINFRVVNPYGNLDSNWNKHLVACSALSCVYALTVGLFSCQNSFILHTFWKSTLTIDKMLISLQKVQIVQPLWIMHWPALVAVVSW